jgi:hypothetical protein
MLLLIIELCDKYGRPRRNYIRNCDSNHRKDR